jgi:hypothetical protein
MVELMEPGLERTRPAAKDVGPTAAQDLPDHFAAASKSTADCLDSKPALGKPADFGIRLPAPQVTIVLDPLGSREQGRVDHGRSDDAADRGHHATHHVQESGTGVLHEVPAVGDLQRLRVNPGHRLAVAATTITRDDRDPGVRS